MNIKKMVLGGLFLALGVIIPQLFHLTAIPQAGNVFLPMHIPVILAGFITGPWYGLIVGILSPVVSSLITGMPPMARLPFMVVELAVYGFTAGLLFHKFKMREKKLGIYITLIASMICGRAAYMLTLFVALHVFEIPCGGPIAAISATVSGTPGIIIQLILIPTLVYLLRRGAGNDELFQ